MLLPKVRSGNQNNSSTDAPKWFGELVHFYSGSADQIIHKIPSFDRRPFAIGAIPQGEEMAFPAFSPRGENRFWDVIVRLPIPACVDEQETPVGVVSKAYKLVQHKQLFDEARQAIECANIDCSKVVVNVAMSAYGTRMAINFMLPDEYGFDPGDGEKVALQFVCLNSVDGSCRLTIMMGWFRFVCTNGLIVGTSRLRQRLIHNESLQLPDLTKVLSEGIRLADKEKGDYKKWVQTPVNDRQLISWVDGPLCKKWGVLAAARTYLICRSGCDGHFVNPFEKSAPHQKRMKAIGPVPGARPGITNAYSASQALAWIAKERRDLQEQVNGMREIPSLMGKLIAAASEAN